MRDVLDRPAGTTIDVEIGPRAFNAGCDARLLGLSPGACPYGSGKLADKWMEGWVEVDLNHGKNVRDRWHAEREGKPR